MKIKYLQQIISKLTKYALKFIHIQQIKPHQDINRLNIIIRKKIHKKINNIIKLIFTIGFSQQLWPKPHIQIQERKKTQNCHKHMYSPATPLTNEKCRSRSAKSCQHNQAQKKHNVTRLLKHQIIESRKKMIKEFSYGLSESTRFPTSMMVKIVVARMNFP